MYQDFPSNQVRTASHLDAAEHLSAGERWSAPRCWAAIYVARSVLCGAGLVERAVYEGQGNWYLNPNFTLCPESESFNFCVSYPGKNG